MFDQIFGNYLVKTGRITKEQLSDVIESESKVRVKPVSYTHLTLPTT